LSRNRAATVGGTAPLPGADVQEYDPRIVDVLDVIGKCGIVNGRGVSGVPEH
jgi:hypothetical protein